MKQIHRILTLAAIAMVLAAIGLPPSGVTFADEAFKTTKVSFSSLDEAVYPLDDGFVISIHMNGPVYFEKKEFQLCGAKPDAQFSLYREFTENVYIPGTTIVVIPAGALLPAEGFIWTDKQGNGHIITNQSSSAPNLQLLKSLGIDHLAFKNVLFEVLEDEDSSELVAAYESETLVTYIDFDWIP